MSLMHISRTCLAGVSPERPQISDSARECAVAYASNSAQTNAYMETRLLNLKVECLHARLDARPQTQAAHDHSMPPVKEGSL
jgi:hypothetical protein